VYGTFLAFSFFSFVTFGSDVLTKSSSSSDSTNDTIGSVAGVAAGVVVASVAVAGASTPVGAATGEQQAG
jgi:hypothetical protein